VQKQRRFSHRIDLTAARPAPWTWAKFPTKSNWVILAPGSKGSDPGRLEHRIDIYRDIEVEDPAVQKSSVAPTESACGSGSPHRVCFRGRPGTAANDTGPPLPDKEEEAGSLVS